MDISDLHRTLKNGQFHDSNGTFPGRCSIGSLPSVFINPVRPTPATSNLSLPFAGLSPSQLCLLPTTICQQIGLPRFLPTLLTTASMAKSMVSVPTTIPEEIYSTSIPRLRATSCQPPCRRVTNSENQHSFFTGFHRDEGQPLDLTLHSSNKVNEKVTAPSIYSNNPLVVDEKQDVLYPKAQLQIASPDSDQTSNNEASISRSKNNAQSNNESTVQKTNAMPSRRRRKTVSCRNVKSFHPTSTDEETERNSPYGRNVLERAFLSTVSDNEEYVTVNNVDDAYYQSSECVRHTRSRRSHSANEDRFAHERRKSNIGEHSSENEQQTREQKSPKPKPNYIEASKVVQTPADSMVCNPRMRRFPEMTPKEVKDETYWEKRVKNNEAARRSRRARKTKETKLREYAEKLEKANAKLLEEIEALKSEVCRLQSRNPDVNGDCK